jgi:hypothetical protein
VIKLIIILLFLNLQLYSDDIDKAINIVKIIIVNDYTIKLIEINFKNKIVFDIMLKFKIDYNELIKIEIINIIKYKICLNIKIY